MPRREINNPTQRILRLLEDLEELEAAYDEAAGAIAELSYEAFESLAPKPTLKATTEERVRQQLMGRKISSLRQRMRLRRARGQAARPHLSAQQTAAIEEALGLVPSDEPDEGA